MQGITFLRRGFTLIELLLVIGIIGLLSSIVIVVINPTKQLADAQDARRRSDLKAISDAVYQYYLDEEHWPLRGSVEQLSLTVRDICHPDCSNSFCYVNFFGNEVRAYLNDLAPDYLSAIPLDPENTIPIDLSVPLTNRNYYNGVCETGYQIHLDEDNRIVVIAPNGSNGEIVFSR